MCVVCVQRASVGADAPWHLCEDQKTAQEVAPHLPSPLRIIIILLLLLLATLYSRLADSQASIASPVSPSLLTTIMLGSQMCTTMSGFLWALGN